MATGANGNNPRGRSANKERYKTLAQAETQASLVLAGRTFAWGQRTHIMGIVNATPDSFSGDGLGYDAAAAVARGLRFVADGADILDVGGESTRPGAEPVPADEEMRRILPVIAGLRARTDVPISVDTFKAEVASAAVRAGAVMINDVWGLRRDPRIADVAASSGAALVIVHNRPASATIDGLGGMVPHDGYTDLLGEIRGELLESAAVAERAGVPRGRIILDPGLGFAKTPAHNMELLRGWTALRVGYPLLIGPSRKSFIGRVLGLGPAERDEGTAAVVSLLAAQGAEIIRVHDVRTMVRVVRVVDAIVGPGRWAGVDGHP